MTFLPKSLAGQQEMVSMITKMADLDNEIFDYTSSEAVDRFIQCATQALPFFSKSSKSTSFLQFLVMKVSSDWTILLMLTSHWLIRCCPTTTSCQSWQVRMSRISCVSWLLSWRSTRTRCLTPPLLPVMSMIGKL